MLILMHASGLSEKFHKHLRFLRFLSLLKSLYIKNDINQILVKDEHFKDSYSYYSKEQLLNRNNINFQCFELPQKAHTFSTSTTKTLTLNLYKGPN